MTSNGPALRYTGPLGKRLANYSRTESPTKQNNAASRDDELQIFVDAMRVREEVFVHEQKVPLENEYDDDDPHCVHVVQYQSIDGHAIPIGTIRIVPASSHMHLQLDKHRNIDGSPYEGEARSSKHDGKEPFIKLGRLAVTAGQRGHGYAADLVNAALEFASSHPDRLSSNITSQQAWDGLVLIHAQQQVQKFWAKHGFELDEATGIWDEEGIDHVAMWRRVPLSNTT